MDAGRNERAKSIELNLLLSHHPPSPVVKIFDMSDTPLLLNLTPSPDIPVEIQSHILSFCDQGTLASPCLGSLAFLERASRLLYRDIDVQGFPQPPEALLTEGRLFVFLSLRL